MVRPAELDTFSAGRATAVVAFSAGMACVPDGAALPDAIAAGMGLEGTEVNLCSGGNGANAGVGPTPVA